MKELEEEAGTAVADALRDQEEELTRKYSDATLSVVNKYEVGKDSYTYSLFALKLCIGDRRKIECQDC